MKSGKYRRIGGRYYFSGHIPKLKVVLHLCKCGHTELDHWHRENWFYDTYGHIPNFVDIGQHEAWKEYSGNCKKCKCEKYRKNKK